MAVSRDDHLFGPGPKRILALGGGGTRGIIDLAFLARIEDWKARRENDPNGVARAGRFCLGGSQHRPVREPKSIRLRIFVLPSSWTPL
jgi:hypothetical protein